MADETKPAADDTPPPTARRIGSRVIRVGVLTSGGDCPGLNSVIKWIVRGALDDVNMRERGEFIEVFGIKDGWKGLMRADVEFGRDRSGNVFPFRDDELVRSIDRTGGTILGSSRTNPMLWGPEQVDESERLLANVEELRLDALIVIGGEGSLTVANQLNARGLPVIGVPKTIDMDIGGTEYTIGFESAVQIIMNGIDNLRTTAGSHARVFVVETMGRNCGELAIQGGIAGGAFMVLVPEYDFDLDRVADRIRRRKERGIRYAIVVAAEGAKPTGSDYIYGGKKDDIGRPVLGGIGVYLQEQIEERTDHQTRSVVLSHLQRGGPPCAFDRRLGRQMGLAAIELVEKRRFGHMVAVRDGKVTSVPLASALGPRRVADADYDAERYRPRYRVLA